MSNHNLKPYLLQGEIFTDYRGIITSLNQFDFEGVNRFYFIHHPDKAIVRGWHGHQFEKKWFYCVKGSFTIALIKIDDWEHPSETLIPDIFQLSESNSQILIIPEVYANCIKANQDDSTLMVLSGKKLDEALLDSWRYDKNLWVDWNNY